MTLGDDLPDVKPHFPFGVSRPDEPPQRWSSKPAAPKQPESRSAFCWLLDTNTSLRTSYEEACSELAPSLRRRGCSVGEQLMETLMMPPTPPPESVDTEDPDNADPLDPFISPLLDPFMETGQLVRQGLQQPFQDAYQTARKQVIAGTIGTGLVGLLAGFLLGRYVRGDRK